MPSASKWARLADEALKERRPVPPPEERLLGQLQAAHSRFASHQLPNAKAIIAAMRVEATKAAALATSEPAPGGPTHQPAASVLPLISLTTPGAPAGAGPRQEEPPANELPLPQTGPQDKDEGPALSTPAPPAGSPSRREVRLPSRGAKWNRLA